MEHICLKLNMNLSSKHFASQLNYVLLLDQLGGICQDWRVPILRLIGQKSDCIFLRNVGADIKLLS